MPTLRFTPNLQRHLRCSTQEVSGATVREALTAAFGENVRLRSYILEDDGSLRKHMNIFVNGEQVADRKGLSDPIESEDEIYVMQALSGG